MYLDPLAATTQWLEEVVIGQQFCPFAKKPFVEGRVEITVLPEEQEKLLDAFATKFHQLASSAEIETSLLICTSASLRFSEFYATVQAAEQLSQALFPGVFSLASFHPEYQFAGYQRDAVENYIQRAPFPTLHIIRERSIEWALESYPEIEKIPERNGRKAQELGKAFFARYLYLK